MNKGLISIVLPVYNGERYIADSINSIIGQTYRNWELIIINDCSTDNTLSIVEKFEKNEKRIRVISNSKNLKLPASLNKGFEFATGEYYTWTSDDNIYKPQALQVLVKAIKKHPEVSMVYSDYDVIDEQGTITEKLRLAGPSRIVLYNPFGACFLYTAISSKKIGQYDINMFLAEDYDYWIRMQSQGIIKHIPQNLYYYRRHSQSLTETKKKLIKQQTFNVLKKNFSSLLTIAENNNLKYSFFDNVLDVSGEEYSFMWHKFISLDRLYVFHVLKKWIKERFINSKIWMILRSIKRRIQR